MEEKQVKVWILYLIYNFDKKKYIFTQFNTSYDALYYNLCTYN